MTGIVRLALVRPYTFVVMAILILILGVMSIKRTPTDIFPEIGIPVISVVWSYTGLPPADMSGRIVSIYERVLTTTVNDIEHIESQSVPGYGIVKIYFQPSVNIAAAQSQVVSISQTILKQMPAGINPPQMIVYNASSVPIIQLALSSPTLSETALQDLGLNFVRPALATIPGASLPYPYGGKTRQVQIDLDQSALRAHGISAADVGAALAKQNLITPVGTQKIGAYEWTIDLNDSPKRIEDFNNLPVKVVDGVVVFMRDLAHVHNGSPPQTSLVQLDGRKGVLMSVLKNGTNSTLDIIADVKARLPAIRDTLPPGVDLKYVADQSGFVRSSISSVVREGVIAAALTAAMILLFLGSWRSTLIITVSIPLAILVSISMLSILGQTINVMTLGGLALAVGILVDDATVTIENINRHMEELDEDILTAITLGAKEIMPPATIALFCICLAFVPLLALGGVAGFLFRPLAEAVVFAMIASYVLTYTLVPTMAHALLRHQGHHGAGEGEAHAKPPGPFKRFQLGFERRFEALRQGYIRLLGRALERPRPFAAVFLALALLSLGLVPFLGRDFFPAVEADGMRIHLRAADRHARRGDHADHRRGRARGASPAAEEPRRQHRQQHRSAGQRHQHHLWQHRHDRRLRRRHAGHAERGRGKSGRLRPDAAGEAAGPISRGDLFLSAARHGQPDPEFRIAGAARCPGDRRQHRRQSGMGRRAPGQDAPRARHRRLAHPGALRQSFAEGRLQPRAGRPRRPDRIRCGVEPAGDAFGVDADGPDLLARSQERRVLSRLGADAAIRHRHDRRPQDRADDRGAFDPAARRAGQLLARG